MRPAGEFVFCERAFQRLEDDTHQQRVAAGGDGLPLASRKISTGRNALQLRDAEASERGGDRLPLDGVREDEGEVALDGLKAGELAREGRRSGRLSSAWARTSASTAVWRSLRRWDSAALSSPKTAMASPASSARAPRPGSIHAGSDCASKVTAPSNFASSVASAPFTW